MMRGFEFSFDHSPFWLSLILPIAVLVVVWLYFHNKKATDWSSALRFALAAARWTVLVVLAILLLLPNIISFVDEEERPRLLFYRDVSLSMSEQDQQKAEELVAKIKQNLSELYELRFLTFGDLTAQENDATVLIDSLYTDFGAVMASVNSDFYGENIGAVIVATDGINNRGLDPRYVPMGSTAPLFAFGLGDTSVFADLEVAEVLNNQLAFLNNSFEIKVRIRAIKLNGKQSEVRLERNGEVLFRSKIDINKDLYTNEIKFIAPADQLGLNKFTISTDIIDKERNEVNNSASTYIDVLDNRTKVILLAKSPHPDIAFFKRAIETNEQYEVEVQLIKEWNGKTSDHDLFLTHGLPTNADELNLVSRITTDGVPLMAILTPRVSFRHFNALELGVSVDALPNRNDQVGGVLSDEFGLFNVGSNPDLQRYPPLLSPFGEFLFAAESKLVLNQKLGSIKTSKPLVAFVQRDGKKYGFFFAEGWWKWGLFESNVNNMGWTESMIQKSVQYMAIKQKRTRLRVQVPQQIEERENVVFNAEFYNESFELNNEADVKVILKDPSENETIHGLKPTEKAYRSSIGRLSPGEYSWKAVANDGGELFEEKGVFTVTENKTEFNNLVADHSLLADWANGTGGSFFDASGSDQLIAKLKSLESARSVIHTTKDWSSLIEWKWLLLLLISIIGAEWFIRKFTGYV